MLIKDPYLSSDMKHRSYSAFQHQIVPQFNAYSNKQQQRQSQQQKYTHYVSQNINNQQKPQQYNNKNKINNQNYQRQNEHKNQRELRSLSSAYHNQQKIIDKVTKYQAVNQQYHEAMKQRNYQLNTRLNDLTYQKSLLSKRHQQQIMRNSYDKEMIIKKYQQQNQQILRLKRTITQLMQHKARLQSQIDHLMFTIQKQNNQGSLSIKQQLIRMQNMQRTLRNIIDTKDQQLVQFRHRLKSYQDQNKRLNDMNKTLTITRQHENPNINKIDNLSKIQNLDSNTKNNPYLYIQNNKQNLDNNKKDDYLILELNQQKQINQHLINQINLMKKKLFSQQQQQINNIKNNKKFKQNIKNKQQARIITQQQQNNKLTKQQINSQIHKLDQLRQNIMNKYYQIYIKSSKQGQKYKKNSLIIFIQKFKKLNQKQSLKNINEYSITRQNLKCSLKYIQQENMIRHIQQSIPNKVQSKVHSKQGQSVLSTMQHTKNMRNKALKQKYSQQSNYNNNLLYLFRLLTILSRLKHPIQGQANENIQKQVNNQLLHSIVKAIQNVYQNI